MNSWSKLIQVLFQWNKVDQTNQVPQTHNNILILANNMKVLQIVYDVFNSIVLQYENGTILIA